MAAASAGPYDHLLICAICQELFDDPRSLPCVHSFCFKCLREALKDVQPGDDVTCPACKRTSAMPKGGVGELPRNFILEEIRMADVGKVVEADLSPPLCDNCKLTDRTRKKPAVKYCQECRQQLCVDCENDHSRLAVTRNHKRRSLNPTSAGM